MTQYLFDIEEAEDSDVRKPIDIVEGQTNYSYYLSQIIYKTLYCSWLTKCLNFQPVINSLQSLRRKGFDFKIYEHPLYREEGIVIKYLETYVSIFKEKSNLYVNIDPVIAPEIINSNSKLKSLLKVG